MQASFPLLNLCNARVMIVGDVMLDRYWSGTTSRISPEAPVPVVHIQQVEERPGGAGNVALNITALDAKADLLSICGADINGDILQDKLTAAQVRCHLQRHPNLPTVTKLRILSQHQQLIRLDFEEPNQIVDQEQLLNIFTKQLASTDVVILSDYAKGCLRFAPQLIAKAKQAGIPVLVDPKGHDFSIYQGATLITPNLKEFEIVVGPCRDENDLVSKGIHLIRAHNLEALLITRGEHGMTLIQEGKPELHLPAHAREVYDVTGAGDTVIAVLAAAYAVKRDLAQAANMANIAAGIVVGKLGAATVTIPELRRAIQTEHTMREGVVTEEQLIIAVEDARAHGEKIVMTGGCFDILHAGHVAYLEEAKKQGDRLIVAVNDDQSVMQLKGPSRPINTLARRMAVLAGLSAVDWVVPFSELTPERIVSHILPDVWVKGGDYKVEDLPEARAVLQHGGSVKILPFIDGCSTTNIVESIRISTHGA